MLAESAWALKRQYMSARVNSLEYRESARSLGVKVTTSDIELNSPAVERLVHIASQVYRSDHTRTEKKVLERIYNQNYLNRWLIISRN